MFGFKLGAVRHALTEWYATALAEGIEPARGKNPRANAALLNHWTNNGGEIHGKPGSIDSKFCRDHHCPPTSPQGLLRKHD